MTQMQTLYLDRLFDLPPIRRALKDPHYRLVKRPVDCRWADARITGRVSGFNPHRHEFYYSERSQLAAWLAGEQRSFDLPLLTKEALSLAHDYLHSWSYRCLHQLAPALADPALDTEEDIERHSFLLVLTECVAVVGLDYWYLSVQPASLRCGDSRVHGGPLTVNYDEERLPAYRASFPSLTVQEPAFFHRILKLYAEGCFDGVDEQDLIYNAPLADWLIRELLIAPRQRTLARHWSALRAGRGGMAFADDGAAFKGWLARFAAPLEALAVLLWDTMAGRAASPPPPEPWGAEATCRVPTQPVTPDYRFVHWRSAPASLSSASTSAESWTAYVDQIVGLHEWPAEPELLDDIAQALPRLRHGGSAADLHRLLSPLNRLSGHDAAPEQLIIVN